MIADFLPVAILVPSLNRPQRIIETAANIHRNTPQPHTILWMVSDPESIEILTELDEPFIDDSAADDRRYVTRMNVLAREARQRGVKTMFFGSDDVVHHSGWFEAAVAVMESLGKSVIVVNDLHNPQGTQALIRTEYLDLAVIDSPGDAFHTGYLHNFADNEMFYTASRRGQIARAFASHVEHLHPHWQSHNSIAWDSTYQVAIDGWAHDEALFRRRAELISGII